MAIYRFSMKHGSRAKGSSSGSHVRYILREQKYSYGAHELRYTESGNMPSWTKSEAYFWDQADTYEAVNARIYTEFEIAFPRELTTEQQISLAKEFIDNEIGNRHPYTMAIHESQAQDGGTNPHMHVMFSTRKIDEIKRGESIFFKRANSKNPALGGALKDRSWMKRERLQALRLSWETHCNQALSNAGKVETVDSRTLKEQGIDRDPQPKLTPHESILWKKGIITERVSWILIQQEIAGLQAQLKLDKKAIRALESIENLRTREGELNQLVDSEKILLEDAERDKQIATRYVEFYDRELEEECCKSWDEAWKGAFLKLFGRVAENYNQDLEAALGRRQSAKIRIEKHTSNFLQSIFQRPNIVLSDVQEWVTATKERFEILRHYRRFENQRQEYSTEQTSVANELASYTEKIRKARDEAIQEVLSKQTVINQHQAIVKELRKLILDIGIDIKAEQDRYPKSLEFLTSEQPKAITVGQRSDNLHNTKNSHDRKLQQELSLSLEQD